MTCNQRGLSSGFGFGFETQANYASDEQTAHIKVYVLFHQGERVRTSWLAEMLKLSA